MPAPASVPKRRETHTAGQRAGPRPSDLGAVQRAGADRHPAHGPYARAAQRSAGALAVPVSPSGPPAVAQVIAPGLVLLGPQGVKLAVRALELATTRAVRDGIGLPPQARELHAALVAGSQFGTTPHAHAGTLEPDIGPMGAPSPHDVGGVQEVVQMLKVSREYACRLLRAGAFETGRKVAGRWQVDRIELQAWRDDRQEARTA